MISITNIQAAEVIIRNISAYNLSDQAGRYRATLEVAEELGTFKKMVLAGEIKGKRKKGKIKP